MKKLRLDIDELHVEAFPTTELGTDGNGTVFAHSLNPNCGYADEAGPCMDSGTAASRGVIPTTASRRTAATRPMTARSRTPTAAR